MGCYLGDNVFVTSDTTASIVCNGRKDVECTQFPADKGNYTVYLLVTTSGTGTIGGGTVYLEYYNGSTWVQMGNYIIDGIIGPGWTEVHFTITPNGWVGRMRLRDDNDRCTKEWIQYSSTPGGSEISAIQVTQGQGTVILYKNDVSIGTVSASDGKKTFGFTKGDIAKFVFDATSGYSFEKFCSSDLSWCTTTNPYQLTIQGGYDFKVLFKTVPPSPLLTSIVISSTATVKVGETKTIDVVCKDQNNAVMTCPGLTWGSGNTGIVTVSNSGVITGISAGTMPVNCWDPVTGIASNLCQVTVIPGSEVNTWWCDTSTKSCSEQAVPGGYATKALCDAACSGGSGGIQCNTDQINIFGQCYKKNDVYIVAGLFTGLLILKRLKGK